MPFFMAFGLFLSVVQAQNEGQYTHFMFNRLSYNPAYAGSSGDISATVLYRNQWMGLKLQPSVPGSEAGSTPVNILASADLPVSFLHGGLGLVVHSEKYGFHNNVAIDIDYAFRIFWGPGNLSAAIEANLYDYGFDRSKLVGFDDLSGSFSSPATSSSDPMLSGEGSSDFLFDVSTGVYYQIPANFYAGLSVKNLLASSSSELNISNVRTLYLMGGYEYNFTYNPSFTLKPSALIKTADFAVFQIDLACLLDYRNIFWAGLGYRLYDAFTFMAGVNALEWLQTGVAYDLTTSKLGFGGGRSIGTIELYLNVHFQINPHKKPPSSYGNTRYLK